MLDKKKQPLMPCSEKRARLHRGRAVVVRLKDRVGGAVQSLRIKLDPGSKTTGIALTREDDAIDLDTGEVTRKASVML